MSLTSLGDPIEKGIINFARGLYCINIPQTLGNMTVGDAMIENIGKIFEKCSLQVPERVKEYQVDISN